MRSISINLYVERRKPTDRFALLKTVSRDSGDSLEPCGLPQGHLGPLDRSRRFWCLFLCCKPDAHQVG